MKKMMLILLVLTFVAPAMADPNAIHLWLEQVSPDSNQVLLRYTAAAADPNRPRAWGLIISADNGATMKNFTASKVGESTSGSKGYGVFPGTITINASGTVTAWGSPAYTGAGTSTVIVELGSLYSGGSSNAPATDADLLTFTVSKDCNVSVGENAADGCVVDEKNRKKHPTNHGDKVQICVDNALAAATDLCSTDFGDPDGQIDVWDYLWLNTFFGCTCNNMAGCGDPGTQEQCELADLCSEDFGDPDGQVTVWDYLYLNTFFGCPVCQSPPESCPG